MKTILKNRYLDIFNQVEDKSAEQYIAGILYWREKMLKMKLNREEFKKNKTDLLAENAIEFYMNKSLKKIVKNNKERKIYIEKFISILDLRGSGGAYTGLPFLTGFKNHFSISTNFENLILLTENIEKEVSLLAQAYQNGSSYVPKTFGSLMQDSFTATPAEYMKMGGLVLSRDVSLYRILMQLENFDPNNIMHKKIMLLPLYVRLIAEFDRAINKSVVDRTSYINGWSSILKKNYYFWSGSYVFTSLLEQNVPTDVAMRMVGTFPLIYKKLKSLKYEFRNAHIGATIGFSALSLLAAVSNPTDMMPYWLSGSILLGGAISYIMMDKFYSQTNTTNAWDTYQVTRLSLKGSSAAKHQILESCSEFLNKSETLFVK